MIKSAILITNDESIIEQNKELIHIENSIYLGKELFPRLNYIIIDYDTFLVEEDLLEELRNYKDKILVLGDGYIDDMRSVSKGDFHAENIDVYYPHDIERDIPCVDGIDMDISLEIDRIINLYTEPNSLIDETEKELLQASQEVRKGVYKLISMIDEGNKIKSLKWNNPTRMEYTLAKIKQFR